MTDSSEKTARLALATTLAVRDGITALRAGNAITALARFDEALARDPASADAGYQRAVALARLHRFDDALSAARACARAHPSHAPVAALCQRLEQRIAMSASPTLPPPPDVIWQHGEVVAQRWEVFGSVQGGMGRVYFVRDREWDGMELAVKTLVIHPGATMTEMERVKALFRRETQVWLDLGAHPHIVSGFYTLEVQGALRFFMEYVPGIALDAVLRAAKGKLPLHHALDLAIQLAAGVEYVHARGVVHRDLKSGNCLIMEDGTLRVTDFGLGKVQTHAEVPGSDDDLFPELGPGLSVAGAGTPWYMAPEQWRSLGDAGAPADVYAFGVLLYELLTGTYPFDTSPALIERYAPRVPSRLLPLIQGASVSRELLLWILHREVAPLAMTELNAAIPLPLDALARHCMAKSEHERPAMPEVRAALLEIYRDVVGQTYPRELPGALRPTEAGENNRAVSYFVMGEVPRARGILDAWLGVHPTGLYPWINRQSMAVGTGESAPQDVGFEFERHVAPMHPQAAGGDPQVQAFRRRVRPFVPWHASPVGAAAFSPDGSVLALAAEARVVLVEPASGDVVRVLEGHEAPVTSLAFGPGGDVLLTGSHDKTAKLWDVPRGVLLRTLAGHRDSVNAVAFGADGRIALTGGGSGHKRSENAARAWDTATARAIHVLRGHRRYIESVAIAPDGTRAASGSVDGVVHLWDLREAALLYVFGPDDAYGADAVRNRALRRRAERGTRAVAHVAFGPDGRTLLVAREAGELEVWATDSGKLLATYITPRGESSEGPRLLSAAQSRDGRRVAAGDARGVLRVWDAETRALVREVATHAGAVVGVALRGDGAWAVSCGAEGARRWSVDAARDASAWPMLIAAPVSARGLLSFAREREQLVRRLDEDDTTAYAATQALRARAPSYARDLELCARIHRVGVTQGRAVDLRDAWVVRSIALGSGAQSVAFSADGASVLLAESGAAGLTARTWDVRSGTVERALRAHARDVVAAAFSPDGAHVLAAMANGEVALCRAASGKTVRRLAEHLEGVTSVALAGDGRIALAGGEDGTARVFTLEGGTRTLRGHRYGVLAAALSADGRWALTGSWDKTARVWDVATGRCVQVLEGHAGGVAAVAFSPDGRRVVTGSDDGVRVFARADGALLSRAETHNAGVTSVAVTPDGRFVVGGCWDNVARVFRVADGSLARALVGHDYAVTGVAVSPDGASVVTGSLDRTVRLWAMDWEWGFADEMAAELEQVLRERPGARFWPHAGSAEMANGRLDTWLDVYADAERLLSGRDEEWGVLSAKIADKVAVAVRGAGEGAIARVEEVDAALARRVG